MFDVCWAREQGMGYTPQTGNEKFRQTNPCLCGWRESDRNFYEGQQIDGTGRCEIDGMNQEAVNVQVEKVDVCGHKERKMVTSGMY